MTLKESSYVFIYGLVDPVKHEIRYVGKSKDPITRLHSKNPKTGHLAAARRNKDRTHCLNWLRKLDRGGHEPELVILECCSESKWQEREQEWIRILRSRNYPLTNMARGGEGGWAVPIETRRRNGRKLAEHRKKYGSSAAQKAHSRKLCRERRGKPRPKFSLETKAKMSAAKIGTKLDPKILRKRFKWLSGWPSNGCPLTKERITVFAPNFWSVRNAIKKGFIVQHTKQHGRVSCGTAPATYLPVPL